MYCTSCGSNLGAWRNKSCPRCGAPLRTVPGGASIPGGATVPGGATIPGSATAIPGDITNPIDADSANAGADPGELAPSTPDDVYSETNHRAAKIAIIGLVGIALFAGLVGIAWTLIGPPPVAITTPSSGPVNSANDPVDANTTQEPTVQEPTDEPNTRLAVEEPQNSGGRAANPDTNPDNDKDPFLEVLEEGNTSSGAAVIPPRVNGDPNHTGNSGGNTGGDTGRIEIASGSNPGTVTMPRNPPQNTSPKIIPSGHPPPSVTHASERNPPPKPVSPPQARPRTELVPMPPHIREAVRDEQATCVGSFFCERKVMNKYCNGHWKQWSDCVRLRGL